jgi:hypothetical protein
MTKAPCTIAMIDRRDGSNLARNSPATAIAWPSTIETARRRPRSPHVIPEAGFVACDSIAALVGAVARPRPIILPRTRRRPGR